jgi:Family of unknown function (DUF6266)
MGTFKKGILGGFKGTVGTVVGSDWKGITVMRSRPKDRKGGFSPSQLEQQARFALMIKFLQPLADFMNLTYKKVASKMSGFNKVFSDNIKNAVTGVYPAFTVDYAKVLLSKGSLPNAGNPLVASTVAGKLSFTWTDNSGVSKALISDIAFIAVYNEELNHWIFNPNAAVRNAGAYTLDVSAFSGKPVQTYIGFMSADRNRTANSQYTGKVTVL